MYYHGLVGIASFVVADPVLEGREFDELRTKPLDENSYSRSPEASETLASLGLVVPFNFARGSLADSCGSSRRGLSRQLNADAFGRPPEACETTAGVGLVGLFNSRAGA